MSEPLKNGLENQATKCNSSGDVALSINRRNVIKQLATVSTSAGIGLGTIGSAVAASECKDSSANYSSDYGYWWSRSDDGVEAEGCGGASMRNKVHHASNIMYYGSVRNDNSGVWYHDFVTSSHSESFLRSDCYEDWSRYGSIMEHKATFENQLTGSTDIPEEQGDSVKASPPVGGSSVPDIYTDLLYTSITNAIGGLSWPVGTAMSIAGVVVDNIDSSNQSAGVVDYDWKYSGGSFAKCSTHFVSQSIQSHPYADDAVDFVYSDEVWNDNGIGEQYVATEYTVDYNDSMSGSSQSSGLTAPTTSQANGVPVLEKGDTTRDTRGNTVTVNNVSTTVTQAPGKAPVKALAGDLPGPVGDRFDPTQEVTFKRLPLRITQRTISGLIED